MNIKLKKAAFWLTTGVMCIIFIFSALMYFFKYDMVSEFYEVLGFPMWIIYPLAIAKILGVIAILTRKNELLKEWAYAGFFFDAVLATMAHGYAGHGWFGLSTLAIIVVIGSRYLEVFR